LPVRPVSISCLPVYLVIPTCPIFDYPLTEAVPIPARSRAPGDQIDGIIWMR
jgi:hypothetical protein